MFPYPIIQNFDQAETYRDNLTASGEAYLQTVDKLVSTDFLPGQPVNLDRIVKPSNFEKFWLAFSYILLAIGRDISLSDDYLTVRLLEPVPNRQLFSIPV